MISNRSHGTLIVILGNLQILGRTCPQEMTHLLTLLYKFDPGRPPLALQEFSSNSHQHTCLEVSSILFKKNLLHDAIEEPLTSEESLFHKRFFVTKKVLQIIKS